MDDTAAMSVTAWITHFFVREIASVVRSPRLSLPRSSGLNPFSVSFTSIPSSFTSGLNPFMIGRLPVCSSTMSATMTGTTSSTESGSDLRASG